MQIFSFQALRNIQRGADQQGLGQQGGANLERVVGLCVTGACQPLRASTQRLP